MGRGGGYPLRACAAVCEERARAAGTKAALRAANGARTSSAPSRVLSLVYRSGR
jgi:hypothetical protein